MKCGMRSNSAHLTPALFPARRGRSAHVGGIAGARCGVPDEDADGRGAANLGSFVERDDVSRGRRIFQAGAAPGTVSHRRGTEAHEREGARCG